MAQNKQISQAGLLSSYGKLPLTFEQNQGQTDARVKFLARGSGYTVFLSDDQTTTLRLIALAHDPAGSLHGSTRLSTSAAPTKNLDATVQLSLVGANLHAPIEGNDLQPGRSNYFIGNDPARWQRNVSHFARVKYTGVYPGVDLVYYGNQGRLESDYILAPGADPAQIGLQIKGAGAVKLDSQGALVLPTAAGDVVLHKPFAYQETAEGRREVAANFVQHGPRLVGFRVAPYDTSQPLIIDPVMVYSTYLGGSGKDIANSIAVDGTGNAYITGFTLSTATTFPLKNPLPGQGTFLATAVNAQETFVTKLDPNVSGGSSLIYSTYLGGTTSGAADQGAGIAVNANGEAFIVGTTGANDFPTSGSVSPLQSVLPNSSGAAFLTQLNATGSALLYSTYLGGNGHDSGLGIALDPAGISYVTGVTTSTNFPVFPNPGAFQTVNKSQTLNGNTAFISKIDTTKPGNSGLIYSTYLGGTGGETAHAIAVDSTGNAYVTGETQSTDFPQPLAPAPFQPTLAGTQGNAFIAQIDTTVTGSGGLIYSTYLGGAGSSGGGDQGNGIALDGNKNVYVVGTTGSNDFPTSTGAFQTASNNQTVGLLHRQAFVARFDTKSATASRVYSTYLGGSGSLGDAGLGIAVDSLSQAYVSGFTTSSDFPIIAGAPQTNRQGSNAFIAVLDATGTSLGFSTFWGGAGREDGNAIALDNASPPNIYLTGDTSSTPSNPYVPSTTAFQNTLGGLQDAFLTKFSGTASGTPDFSVSVTPASSTVTAGATANFTVTITSITGFNSAVAAACTSATPASTCTLSPTSVTPAANATATISGTISTTALALAPPPRFFRAPPGFPVWLWGFLTCILAILAAWAATRRTRKLAFGFGLLSLLALTGCSGPIHGGTPAGAYTVTVTGTSGALTHSANFTLNVN